MKIVCYIAALIALCGCVTLQVTVDILDTQKFLKSLGKEYSIEQLRLLDELNLTGINLKDEDLRYFAPLKNLQTIRLDRTGINGEGFKYLLQNYSIHSISLSGTNVTDRALSYIGQLPEIKSLDLSNTNVSDKNMIFIENHKGLIELKLNDTFVDDNTLVILSNIINLKKLELRNTNITDWGMQFLSLHQKIERIVLSRCFITDDGIKHLSHANAIKHLNLSQTLITDKALNYLKHLRNLKHLDLSKTAITNKALMIIAQFNQLIHLDISDTKITSKGYPLIKKIKKLRYLNINGTVSTWQKIETLTSEIPDLKINSSYFRLSERKKIPTRQDRKSLSTMYAKFKLKKPIFIGMDMPFSIVFFDENGRIDKDLKLDSDIIFRIDNKVPFKIIIGSCKRSGDGRIVVSGECSKIKNGILRGKISFKKITTGSILKVFLEKKDNEKKRLLYICGSYLDDTFYDIGHIKFNLKTKELVAGKEFTIEVIPFNFLKEQIKDMSARNINLILTVDKAMYINGKGRRGNFIVKPGDFINNIAELKGITTKSGMYSLSFNRMGYKDRYSADTSIGWNSLSLKINPGAHEKTRYRLSEKNIRIGEKFYLFWDKRDELGNKIVDETPISVNITPFTQGSLQIGSKIIKSKSAILRNEEGIIVKKPGKYTVTSDKGKITFKVMPSDVERIKLVSPARLIKGQKAMLIISIFDKYGNPAYTEKKIIITSSSKLIPGGQKILQFKRRSTVKLPVIPNHEGTFLIKVTGIGETITRTITVVSGN